MESRREEASMLQDAEWIIGLAFLMDITGKQKHLNYELKGEGKTTRDTTRDAEEFIFLSFHVYLAATKHTKVPPKKKGKCDACKTSSFS